MRNVVIGVALLASLRRSSLIPREPAVLAEEEKPAADESLLKRVEALEDLLSFHTHERELQDIKARLETLEAAQSNDRSEHRYSEPVSKSPTSNISGELRKLQQDVRSLSGKVAALDRSVSPIKQDVGKLKLSVMRVESSVARIDLSR